MDLGLSDVVVFVYTAAVLLTGAWLSSWGALDVTPTLVGVLGAAAVAWTAYFRWSVSPKLAKLADEDWELGQRDGDDVP